MKPKTWFKDDCAVKSVVVVVYVLLILNTEMWQQTAIILKNIHKC